MNNNLIIDRIFATDGVNSQVHLHQSCFNRLLKGSPNPVTRVRKGITTDGYYLSEIQFDNATVASKSRREGDKNVSFFFLPNEVAEKLLVPEEKVANPYDLSKFIAVAA